MANWILTMFCPKHTLCIISDSERYITTLSFAEIVGGRWYWQERTDVLEEKCALVSFFPLQISCGLAWDWTQASIMRGRRLTALLWTLCYIYFEVDQTCEISECGSHG